MINVPMYTPRLPISGGGGIQDLSENAGQNKLLLAQAIGNMLGKIYGQGKQQRQTQQQFQQVSPILAREGDMQANLQEALRAISEMTAKRPTGLGGIVDRLNPFAPARGGGSELEQALLQQLTEKEPQRAKQKLGELIDFSKIDPKVLQSPAFRSIMQRMGYGDLDITPRMPTPKFFKGDKNMLRMDYPYTGEPVETNIPVSMDPFTAMFYQQHPEMFGQKPPVPTTTAPTGTSLRDRPGLGQRIKGKERPTGIESVAQKMFEPPSKAYEVPKEIQDIWPKFTPEQKAKASQLGLYWESLEDIDKQEIKQALTLNPNNINEILRRLQEGE